MEEEKCQKDDAGNGEGNGDVAHAPPNKEKEPLVTVGAFFAPLRMHEPTTQAIDQDGWDGD